MSQSTVSVRTPSINYDIRAFTSSDEDFEKLYQMWHIVFPEWPIEHQRLKNIMQKLPGQHYIHEKGFCLSFLSDVAHGKIAAIGILPEYRGKGLGTAFIKNIQNEWKNIGRTNAEGKLEPLDIGSQTPRFWPAVPTSFSQEVIDFYIHRGKVQYSKRFSD